MPAPGLVPNLCDTRESAVKMQTIRRLFVTVLSVALLAAAVCHATPGSGGADAADTRVTESLAGTHWRLVRFVSMDDAIGEIRPADRSAYRMTLSADRSVQMQLNCNRAIGSWSAEPAGDGVSGRFTFGPLATTKALCPPPSMDERIARDARWVRGYLLRDDQLHLSLMADAGIYSWQPVAADSGERAFEAEPDPALEEALRAAAPDYTRAAVDISGAARYVYARVDLNADGREEVLALIMGSIFCGTGGCNLYVLRETDSGYALISLFPRSRLPVIASPHKAHGWRDLIRLESGGGAAPAYVRHVYDDERYLVQEQLALHPTPPGTPLLDGDYSYASGFALTPRDQ